MMKGKTIAWALIFLGLGLILGMGFGRAVPLIGDRLDSVGRRFALRQDLDSQLERSIEITVPELRELRPIPEIPEIPSIPMHPGERRLRPFASEEVIIRSGPRLTVWGLARTLIGWVINVSASLLIVLGVVLIIRRGRQSVEKNPPKVLNETD